MHSRYFAFLLIFIVFDNGCVKQQYPYLTENDVNEVVTAVINQEGLPVYKNSKGNQFLLNSKLKKLTVVGPGKIKDVVVKGVNFIQYNRVHILRLINSSYFRLADEKYIFYQNKLQDSFKLTRKIPIPFKYTNQSSLTEKQLNEFAYLYILTVPIFSADQQTAYVELEFHCGLLCGRCNGFYLKKLNGKWKVVRNDELWIA